MAHDEARCGRRPRLTRAAALPVAALLALSCHEPGLSVAPPRSPVAPPASSPSPPPGAREGDAGGQKDAAEVAPQPTVAAGPVPAERMFCGRPLDPKARFVSCDSDSATLTDLAPLAGQRQIGALSLQAQHELTDLAPLTTLPALKDLDLFHCSGVTDFSPLSALSALESLALDGTAIADLSPLSGLTKLTRLNINGTGATDLSPLANLTALEILLAKDVRAVDLSPLRGLAQLRGLYLSEGAATDLRPLAALRNSLEVLELRAMPGVVDLRQLSSLHRLKSLDLLGTEVANLRALAPLSKLEKLILGQAPAADVTWLRRQLPKCEIGYDGEG